MREYNVEGRLVSMALINRLDHVIVAVDHRDDWIPVIQRVLALEPGRMLDGAGQGSSGFSNAEFAIGDGFIGVVTPAGDRSQLRTFLDKFGDGFYAMSIDVGDPERARVVFETHGIDHRSAEGETLMFAGPRQTHGVLFQVIGGMLLGQGANPRYSGLARLTVAVHDLDKAAADFERIFDLGAPQPTRDDPPGTRGVIFPIAGMDVSQQLALVTPTDDDCDVAHLLASRGQGMYSFAIACSDIAGEVERLKEAGVGVHDTAGGVSIDPQALRGLRVELLPV